MENMKKLYKVSGRSMEADFIYQGDFVIVDATIPIRQHDIVVLALANGTFLVKHFYKKNKHLFFYPFSLESSLKKSYRPLDEATVIGKVVAIVCIHKKKEKVYL